MANGIDVSTYQGSIDWNAVKNSGQVSFAYAKATEGTGFSDDQFQRNHDQCKALGIAFGAYHFFHFGADAAAQADHFLQSTDGRLGTLIPMVDVEAGGQDGVTDLDALVAALAAFTQRVEAAIGKRMIIYSDYGDWNGFMQGSSAFSGHPFWVAEYNDGASPALPSGFTQWCLWQYSDAGAIPGISGSCDLDRTQGSIGSISL